MRTWYGVLIENDMNFSLSDERICVYAHFLSDVTTEPLTTLIFDEILAVGWLNIPVVSSGEVTYIWGYYTASKLSDTKSNRNSHISTKHL